MDFPRCNLTRSFSLFKCVKCVKSSALPFDCSFAVRYTVFTLVLVAPSTYDSDCVRVFVKDHVMHGIV